MFLSPCLGSTQAAQRRVRVAHEMPFQGPGAARHPRQQRPNTGTAALCDCIASSYSLQSSPSARMVNADPPVSVNSNVFITCSKACPIPFPASSEIPRRQGRESHVFEKRGSPHTQRPPSLVLLSRIRTCSGHRARNAAFDRPSGPSASWSGHANARLRRSG